MSSKKTWLAASNSDRAVVKNIRGSKARGKNIAVQGIPLPVKTIRRNNGKIANSKLAKFEQTIETMNINLGIGTWLKSRALALIECIDINDVL